MTVLTVCACGCEITIEEIDDRGRTRQYVSGHNRRRPIEERFWEKVLKSKCCWEWKASTDRKGYGCFSFSGGSKAHQFSWQIHFGPRPAGLWVLHKCDNPPCVRPDHLFLGTSDDNIKDMIEKGRAWFSDPVTHCKHGHEYTPENTYVNPRGSRSCRVCARRRYREFYERSKGR